MQDIFFIFYKFLVFVHVVVNKHYFTNKNCFKQACQNLTRNQHLQLERETSFKKEYTLLSRRKCCRLLENLTSFCSYSKKKIISFFSKKSNTYAYKRMCNSICSWKKSFLLQKGFYTAKERAFSVCKMCSLTSISAVVKRFFLAVVF